MRADDALKKDKVIQLEGNRAVMLGVFLIWEDTKNKVPFGYVMRTDWEPVPCDCEVCEAKRYFDYYPTSVFDPSYMNAPKQIKILSANVRCLNE